MESVFQSGDGIIALLKERGVLLEQLERVMMELDNERTKCSGFRAELRHMTEERDDAIEYGDCEHQFAESCKKERDEARKCAEEMRDLYAVEIEVSWKAIPLPWEVTE